MKVEHVLFKSWLLVDVYLMVLPNCESMGSHMILIKMAYIKLPASPIPVTAGQCYLQISMI